MIYIAIILWFFVFLHTAITAICLIFKNKLRESFIYQLISFYSILIIRLLIITLYN